MTNLIMKLGKLSLKDGNVTEVCLKGKKDIS